MEIMGWRGVRGIWEEASGDSEAGLGDVFGCSRSVNGEGTGILLLRTYFECVRGKVHGAAGGKH